MSIRQTHPRPHSQPEAPSIPPPPPPPNPAAEGADKLAPAAPPTAPSAAPPTAAHPLAVAAAAMTREAQRQWQAVRDDLDRVVAAVRKEVAATAGRAARAETEQAVMHARLEAVASRIERLETAVARVTQDRAVVLPPEAPSPAPQGADGLTPAAPPTFPTAPPDHPGHLVPALLPPATHVVIDIENGASLRDAFPDAPAAVVIRLRNGSTYPLERTLPPARGLSPDQRFILCNHGDPALPPPRIVGPFWNLFGHATLQHVTLHGLHLDGNGDREHYLLRLLCRVQDLALTGVTLEHARGGLLLQDAPGPLDDIRLQRCLIQHHAPPAFAKHAHGLYAARVNRLAITDSAFHLNGWAPHDPAIAAWNQNHGLYLHECRDASLTGGLIARSSSFALKARSQVTGGFDGLSISDVLFLENPNQITLGGNPRADPDNGRKFWAAHAIRRVHITGNTFLHAGGPVAASDARPVPQKYGVDVLSTDDFNAADNLFALSPLDANGGFCIRLQNSRPALRLPDGLVPDAAHLLAAVQHNTDCGWTTAPPTQNRGFLHQTPGTTFTDNRTIDPTAMAGQLLTSQDALTPWRGGTLADRIAEIRAAAGMG